MPGTQIIREGVKFNTGLVIRSADFLTRVRVDFAENADKTDNDRPYSIAFYNLAVGDRGGDKPIELQHGDSGYIWIDGGESVTHATDAYHTFTIRNADKDTFFSVTIENLNDEL